MSDIPGDLKYTETHEWLRSRSDGLLEVGITDHAQELLGDLVFVELPQPGASFETGQECCVLESVKAAADVYCPVAGTVEAVNEALTESPELINSAPYGEGWLFRIRPDDPAAAQALLDAPRYAEVIADA